MIKPELVIKPSDNNTFVFEGISKDTNVNSWVWDLLNTDGDEPFYAGEPAKAVVLKPTGIIRLTVINSNGCFNVGENKFQ